MAAQLRAYPLPPDYGSRDALNVLAAILAIPKFANGLRVPKMSVHARLADRIRVNEDPATGDLILYLEKQ